MSHGAEVELPHDHSDPFTKKVALCVAIYAVILAVAGTGGKNAGKEMLKEQIASSDLHLSAMNEWAQYQAKTNRESESANKLNEHLVTKLNNMSAPALAEQEVVASDLVKKLA